MLVFPQTIHNVDDRSRGEAELGGALGPGNLAGAGPTHRAERVAASRESEREAEMALFDDPGGGREHDAAGEEDGLGIAHAEGGAASDPAEQIESDFWVGEFEVSEELWGEHPGGEAGARMGLDA